MKPIQVISAPSILGLKPGSVDRLPETLISHGLLEKSISQTPVLNVQTLNSQYSFERDAKTSCLNPQNIRSFSINLGTELFRVLKKNFFPVVLGGDCSILIGILPALKKLGTYGLLFCDAHADFYQPEKSTTGELADMDLAIVTGRGPDILTDIEGLRPYIIDAHVMHIAQRDWEETKKYGSRDIRETAIACFDNDLVQKSGIQHTIQLIVQRMKEVHVEGFWIHFDTDVLSDKENPAVDYRLPGGLSFAQCRQLLKALLETGKIVGMSVTIFNPDLDDDQETVGKKLTSLVNDVFE